jgi:aspartate/methionine/tyrosine aminotransferase
MRRDMLVPVLEKAGFGVFRPDGAYYVMTDISRFGFANDIEFTRYQCARSASRACPAHPLQGCFNE